MTPTNEMPLEIWLSTADYKTGGTIVAYENDRYFTDGTKYTRTTPSSVMVDRAELERVRKVLETISKTSSPQLGRSALTILEAAMKGEK